MNAHRTDYESDAWWIDATTAAGAKHNERCAELAAQFVSEPFRLRCWLAHAGRQYMAKMLSLYVAHRPTGPRSREVLPGAVEVALGGDGHERCVQLIGEKERLIYWLLRGTEARSAAEARRLHYEIAECLADLGYAPDSNRAIQMLELGEPGTHTAPAPDLIAKCRERLALYEQALGDSHRLARSVDSPAGLVSEQERRGDARRLITKIDELYAMPNLHRDR